MAARPWRARPGVTVNPWNGDTRRRPDDADHAGRRHISITVPLTPFVTAVFFLPAALIIVAILVIMMAVFPIEVAIRIARRTPVIITWGRTAVIVVRGRHLIIPWIILSLRGEHT